MKDVVQFIKEVRIELLKVVWPKFDDWVGSTAVVLMIVVVFSLYLGVIDTGLSVLARRIFEYYSG